MIPLLTGARKPEDEWDHRLKANRRLGDHALLRGYDVDKPIIAAVNGFCIAGGFELMQATDLRVAADHARFGLQEVKWAIIPAGGSLVRLPRQMPYCKAMEILLTGNLIDAHEAYRLGLVNYVVPAARSDGESGGTRRRDRRQRTARRARDQGRRAPRRRAYATKKASRSKTRSRAPVMKSRGRTRRSARLYGKAQAELQGTLDMPLKLKKTGQSSCVAEANAEIETIQAPGRDQAQGRSQRRAGRSARHPRARPRRPRPGRVSRAARDARVLGRSRESLLQGDLRLGQEIRLLLRRRACDRRWRRRRFSAWASNRSATSKGGFRALEGSWRSGRRRQAEQITLGCALDLRRRRRVGCRSVSRKRRATTSGESPPRRYQTCDQLSAPNSSSRK